MELEEAAREAVGLEEEALEAEQVVEVSRVESEEVACPRGGGVGGGGTGGGTGGGGVGGVVWGRWCGRR